jgi:hypothetical protein
MKPDTKNWMNPGGPSLTGTQVKALLLVASESRLQAEPLSRRAAELDAMLEEMSRAHGPSASDLLSRAVDPASTVEERTRIKDLAKRLIETDADDAHRDAARLLYHVSVAAALVHHGASISGRPIHKQQRLYEQFAETWTGHAIGDVFRDAAAHARKA